MILMQETGKPHFLRIDIVSMIAACFSQHFESTFCSCYKNPFGDILNGIIVFLAPENVCLDPKIESLSGLEAEILVLKDFYMAEIQDGRHAVF